MKKYLPIFIFMLLSFGFSRAQEFTAMYSGCQDELERVQKLKVVDWDEPDFRDVHPVLNERWKENSVNMWMGAATEGILIRLVVRDKIHNSSFSERNIRRGDALFLGIDMRGDTPQGTISPPRQNDDAVFIFGLGGQGEDAWVDKAGSYQFDRELALTFIRNMERNDKRGLTVYELAIPWKVMNSHPGIVRSVGISLSIKNDVDSEEEDFDWGTCRRWGKDSLILNHFSIPEFPGREMIIIPLKTRLRDQTENAEFLIGCQSPFVDSITVNLGEKKWTVDLTTRSNTLPARLIVHGENIDPDNAFLGFNAYERGEVKNFYGLELETPEILLEKFRNRIRKLLLRSPNEIISTHLKSTLLVVEQAYHHANITRLPASYGNPDDIDQFFTSVGYILSKLPEDELTWETYIRQCIPLTFVFRSSIDYSLQFYSLQMPYNWDEEKNYPLTVYLHGSGPGHPLQGLQNGFDNRWQNTIFREVDIHPDSIPAVHRGFLLAPWGRGNSGYAGFAENDIYECLEIVRHHFNIDSSQIYLSGFSMGCDGSLILGTNRPELWAGINLAAGFHRFQYWSNNPDLIKLKGIPIHLWVGELDSRMYYGMKQFIRKADELGLEYSWKVVPDLPHTYPYAEYMESIGILMERAK